MMPENIIPLSVPLTGNYRYHFLIILYMILLPLGGFSVVNIGQRGIQPSWALGFFIVFIYLIKLVSGGKIIYKDSIIITLIILCFSFFLSIESPFLSGDSSRLMDFFTTFSQFLLSLFIFFAFTSYKIPPSSINKIIRWYIIISAVMATISILQFAFSYFGFSLKIVFTNNSWLHDGGQGTGYEYILGKFKRSAGLLREPRQLGAYLIGGISITLYCLINKNSLNIFRFPLLFPLFILIIIGLLCTMSASAYLIGIVCVFIVVGFHFRFFYNYKSVMKIFLVTILLAFIALILINSTDINNLKYWKRFRLPDIAYLWQVFVDLPDRSMAFGYAHYVGNASFSLHVFSEHLLFGVGINNLQYFAMKGYHGAHQPWTLFGNCGIFGVLAFISFILIFLNQIERLKKKLKKINIQSQDYYTLLNISFLIVLLAPIKGMASLFTYFNNFFWFDITLAGIIYFNLKREIYWLDKTKGVAVPQGWQLSEGSS